MKQISDETRRRMSESAKKRCTDEWRKKKSKQYITPLDASKVQQMYESGMSQVEIAAELGVTQRVIWRCMRVNGIKTRTAAKRDQLRGNNHMWKGGRVRNKTGYVLINMPEHPRAKANNGYVFEHIVIAEKEIGRHLIFVSQGHSDNEIVHHINGIKHDNRPENLQVMTQKEHMKLHNRMRKESDANATGEDHASA